MITELYIHVARFETALILSILNYLISISITRF